MPMSAPCKYLVVAVALGLIVFTLQEADAQLPSIIVHRQSNKVLASSSTTSPGTLTLTERNDSFSQQWIIIKMGSYYMINNSATGLYLDGNGRAAYTHTFNGNNYQQWSIIFVGGVWFRLEQRQTGNVLDGDGTSAGDCGTLNNPTNGQVSYTGRTTLGHTATYSCNTGYNLVGGSTCTCQTTGVWSGSAPACLAVNCQTPSSPANGRVTYTDGTTFGQTAIYSCNTSYDLVGSSIYTCQATRMWSGSEPICQTMDCDTLIDPANGQVSHPRTTLGQTANYSCNTGYSLVGSSTRTCQVTGWSGSAPTCQAVDCGTLNNPANGRVSYTGRTTFGQTATYSCNTGYNLVGGNTRICGATARWSGSAPTCQDLDECTRGTHTCHDNATCNNTQRSYTCSCKTGYIGNGFSCTVLNTSASTTSTQDNLPLVIGVASVAGLLMVITTALIIVICVMMKRRQALSITAGNEAPMDIQKKQMDTEMEEPEYAVPDPSTVMRMKENEAYDTFPN